MVVGSFAALFAITIPFIASAQTGTSSIVTIQAQISSLLDQIKNLYTQINVLKKQASEVQKESQQAAKQEKKQEQQEKKAEQRQLKIARSLFRGLSGDDVRQIQEILAKYPDVYPEGLVTGYFGEATERAVKRFQKKCGIEQVGVVGPKTLAQLAKIFNQTENKLERIGADTSPLFPAFEKIASTTLQATSTEQGNKFVICHNARKKNPVTLTIASSAVFAHLAHGDAIGACTTGGTSTTTPDTIAPVIFSVSPIPSVSSASVAWFTDEAASSRVWYATTLDVMNDASKQSVSDNALITSHNANLTGLTQGTTYYFLIISTDASGNTATSSSNLYLFTTANLSISALSSSSVASTSANVNWQTNTASDSTVWYATSTPALSASDRASVTSALSVTNHSLSLSALATSTTYYYFAVSRDSFGNAATSSEQSFITLAN